MDIGSITQLTDAKGIRVERLGGVCDVNVPTLEEFRALAARVAELEEWRARETDNRNEVT